MASRKIAALAILSAALGAVIIPRANAQESIWSALVLATSEEHPKDAGAAPPELQKYWAKLKNAFPNYNQFELLGQRSVVTNGFGEHWLAPSDDFSLHVECKKSEKPGFSHLKLDLYQEKKLIAQMEVRLAGQNVFFIRGPNYDEGRIIIILMVK